LAVADRKDDVLQSNLATSHREIAGLYTEQGDLDAALVEYRRAIGIREDLLAKDPTSANWQVSLAPLYVGASDVLKRKGDLAAALEQYRKAYTLRRELALRDPTNQARLHSFATTGMSVAGLMVAQNQGLDEAVTLYRASIDTLDDLQPRYDQDVFRCYIKIGDILKSRDDPKGALTEYEVASGIARDSATKDANSAPWQKNLMESYAKIGEFLLAQGRTREAIDHYRKALEFVEARAAEHPDAGWATHTQSLKAEIEKLRRSPEP
jgi:tetratricopeptide (TPR) repeat protein